MPKNIFESAELSLASYAVLNSGLTDQQRNALEEADLTFNQFESFKQRFPEIITQFTDTATGFSVTVFKDASPTGNLTIAFSGTEPDDLEDFGTDFAVAADGSGFDQIMTMYNWWQLVPGTPGQNVSSVQ